MSSDRKSDVVTPRERSDAAREHNPHPASGPAVGARHRPGAHDDQTGQTGMNSTADRDLQQKPAKPTTTRPGGFSP
ncbi:hypothetical protein [Indioceanicola profundi]|uniref:hypothetical protein n=1 Tax=Indioceanicola profundi TaxID=2220096 RepID=UPI000E6AD046|nr:hypothetical protein [Indioceanicola profundi]